MEWISVEDRLPEINGWFRILYIKHPIPEFIEDDCYYTGIYWQLIGLKKVTHWQKLPQPKK